MESKGIFWTCVLGAAGAIVMYVLSAAGRSYRKRLAAKSTACLVSLQKRAIVTAWLLYAVTFCVVIALVERIMATRQVHANYLLILIFNSIVGSIAYVSRELSGYASSEIEARKRV